MELLELDVVLFLHDQMLREYGGVHGVKDENLLRSALDRPANKLAYGDPGTLDIYDIAASYAFGLAMNHAFNDANKRTAWAACVLCLKTNGIEIGVPAADAVAQMIALVEHRIDEAVFGLWLRDGRTRGRRAADELDDGGAG